MNLEKLFSLGAAIVGLATVTVIVTSPQTANVIRATGSAFSGSLRAATQQ